MEEIARFRYQCKDIHINGKSNTDINKRKRGIDVNAQEYSGPEGKIEAVWTEMG